jgi:hypothetical protein
MLPSLKPNNPPMTPLQRRVWVALEQQQRRRRRRAAGLTPGFSVSLAGTVLNIVQTGPNAFYAIGLEYSADGATDWTLAGDATFGTTHFDLAGFDAGYYRVCWEDSGGAAQAPFSNVVHYIPPEPAILLTSDGHGRLSWTLNFTTECDNINIYKSDDGVTWGTDAYDGWFLAAGYRECTGVPGYFRICVCDANGKDVPPYSNAVYSDGMDA